ncbi:MAG: hypothetical protein QOI21_32 [Actinomycetota bacterium]|jgi:hypothetical protein|nr:hypothetical protein [Actinomycetota bacterium]
MTADIDLFGNPLDLPAQRDREPLPVNDMTLIEKVLQIAENTGYVLVGPAERVYHLFARNDIESAPIHEAEAVHQLLDAKWLTKGGTHFYTCYGHSGSGNSVLVPRATKNKARHWRSLHPLTTRKTSKEGISR